MRFDHVGILVEDLEAAKAFARDVLGLGEPARVFDSDEQGLHAAFFPLGDGVLEVFTLASGRAPDGPATIDHVAVRVDDLDAERDRLAAHGVRFTAVSDPAHIETPVELRGKRHLWTDPATSGGYRVQLIEGSD
jgi:catechol 2,3-dioxygenase-like lactoylglutathione lyase family enzyme